MSMLFRIFHSIARPFLEIKHGERKKAALMFVYFFLTISLIYILKPVRSSLFLGEFGAEKLPFVYIGEGVWLVLIVWIYTRAAKRLSKMTLYTSVIGFMALNLVVFWFFLGRNVDYLSAFFYIWVAAFSITMTTVFWTLANDIFNPAEAKRLFGVIISGGSLGGILGGVITNQAVHMVGTEALLLVAAGILVLCIIIVLMLSKEISSVDRPLAAEEEAGQAPASPPPVRKSTARLLLGSSYLLMLAGIVIISKMSSTIIDAQFNKVVELSIAGKEARTAYFGGFWAWLNGISFCLQFFLTSLVLRYLGVGFSLWLLPAGTGALSFLSFFYPHLGMAQTLRIFDGSASYSFQLASKETLYLPLSSTLRHRVKPVIDMLGFRAAKSLGGVLILVVTSLTGLAYERLGLLVTALVPVWAVITWQMKKAYSRLLRTHLLNQRRFDKAVEVYDAADVMGFLHDEKTFKEISGLMKHPSSYARKLAAAAVLTYAYSANNLKTTQKVVEQILQHEKPGSSSGLSGNDTEKQDAEFVASVFGETGEVREGGLHEKLAGAADEILMKISEVIRDPEEPMENKRQAIRILEYIPRQETADLIVHRLAGRQEHALRFLMVKTLNRIKKKNMKIEINRFLIKSEIARERTLHGQILKLRAFYKKEKGGNLREDYIDIALRAVLDETQERIFQYLKLLYPGEAMATIYEEISGEDDEDSSRSHAIELLANTLEPDLLIMIQPVLDNRLPVYVSEREARSILRSFVKNQDYWFSLIALFLIADRKLGARWPELSGFDGPESHPLFVNA